MTDPTTFPYLSLFPCPPTGYEELLWFKNPIKRTSLHACTKYSTTPQALHRHCARVSHPLLQEPSKYTHHSISLNKLWNFNMQPTKVRMFDKRLLFPSHIIWLGVSYIDGFWTILATSIFLGLVKTTNQRSMIWIDMVISPWLMSSITTWKFPEMGVPPNHPF